MGKQEFIVVKCVQCATFQVELVKKSNKFDCSICHEKQTVMRIYARSSKAKDVREVVQAYNAARGDVEAAADQAPLDGTDWDCQHLEERDAGGEAALCGQAAGARDNKWAEYAEEEDVRWTVALPENAPAVAGRAAARGGKRKRPQQEQADLEDSGFHTAQQQGQSRQQGQGSRAALAHANRGQQPAQSWDQPSKQASLQPSQQWLAAGAASTEPDRAGAPYHQPAQQPAQQQQQQQQRWPVGGASAAAAGKWASFVSEDD